MSNMLQTVIHDDFVWTAIASVLPPTRKGSNGAQMICCPMCPTRGETPDRRYRCGIMRNPDIYVHCFNCGFVTGFKPGETISYSLRKFLEHLGMSDRDVKSLNLKAMQYRRMISASPEAQAMLPTVFEAPTFPSIPLPEGALKLEDWLDAGVEDQDFIDICAYLLTRGDVLASATNYFWTPNKADDFNRRLIIPFYHEGQIVGYTGRYIDKSNADHPKYHTRSSPNFIFNSEAMNKDRKFLFVVEGPTDALSIDGVATLGAKMSDEQTRWLNASPMKKIVIADRDKAGQRLIEHALANNWMVAFPKLKDGHGFQNWWSGGVKDVSEAVREYGKLYTVRSILSSATAGKTEIGVKQKFLY